MNVDPAADTTTQPTTIKNEIVQGIYHHIADVINRAGLQLAATAHASETMQLSSTASIPEMGTCVLYVPSNRELLTQRQRLVLFKIRWYSDEILTVYAANCSIDLQCPKFERSPLEIADDDDMPTFRYNIFDVARSDELGRWVITEASKWLLVRHELLR